MKVHQGYSFLGSRRRSVDVAAQFGIAAVANADILFHLDAGCTRSLCERQAAQRVPKPGSAANPSGSPFIQSSKQHSLYCLRIQGILKLLTTALHVAARGSVLHTRHEIDGRERRVWQIFITSGIGRHQRCSLDPIRARVRGVPDHQVLRFILTISRRRGTLLLTFRRKVVRLCRISRAKWFKARWTCSF